MTASGPALEMNPSRVLEHLEACLRTDPPSNGSPPSMRTENRSDLQQDCDRPFAAGRERPL